MTPDDPVGEEAYCVIRDAMRSTAMVGVSRLVLNRRERAVILKPRDNGIVLWTLRFGDEVRDPGEYFASIREAKPDPELMRLIGDLIKSRKKAWSPEMVADPVQAKLLDIIEAKKKGAKKAKAKPSAEPEPPSNVINIMDALRRSVAARQEDEGALVSEALDYRLAAWLPRFPRLDRRRGGAEIGPRIGGKRGEPASGCCGR